MIGMILMKHMIRQVYNHGNHVNPIHHGSDGFLQFYVVLRGAALARKGEWQKHKRTTNVGFRKNSSTQPTTIIKHGIG